MSAHRAHSDFNEGMIALSGADNSIQRPNSNSASFISCGSTAPSASSIGFNKGCLYCDASSGEWYFNQGTALSATWASLTPGATGQHVFTSAVVLGAGATVSTSQTLEVTTADSLTVAGLIVPTSLEMNFIIGPHASITEYHLFYATAAYEVTRITAVPNLVQGGALTATICKCTGNNAPANGTTPMHTANAIDCNATAHTPQAITLTATGADLQLAATNKIGIDFSAALSTGSITINIRLKRI